MTCRSGLPSYVRDKYFLTSECIPKLFVDVPRQILNFRDLPMKRGAGVARHYLSASRWLERFLAELGLEVRTGDPAEIKAKRVKKQKTDRED